MEEKRIASRSLRISDYHLGAGPSLPDGRPNRHEDFKGDDTYARMLQAWQRRSEPAARLVMEWAGDIVDFHAIPYRGRYGSVPTVEAALEKLEACIKGHRRFWKATREFLKDHAHEIEVTIGNHDFEFAWPEVQARIREYLEVPADDSRLRFVTEVIEGDTARIHGDIFDPLNANPPPDRWFITNKYGGNPALAALAAIVLTYGSMLSVARREDYTVKNVVLAAVGGIAVIMMLGWLFHKIYFWKWGREKKFLNVPYGTIMNSSLGQRLKGYQPWIGRMRNHGAIWLLSLARDWRFGLVAGPALLIHMIYHRFFIDLLDVRRKATFRTTLRLLLSTTRSDAVESEIRKFARAHPEIRYIEYGHTHVVGVQTIRLEDRDVICYNTGMGGEQVRLKKPEFDRFRTPFRRTEAFLRRIAFYWKKRTWFALGLSSVHAALAAATFFARRFFGWFPGWTAWIALAVTAFSLLMRQSYALYVDETYAEYTPLETIVFEDGSRKRDLLRFLPATETFEGYL